MLSPDLAPVATAGVGAAGLLGHWAALELRPGRPALEPIVPLDGGHILYHELLYRSQWPWRSMPGPQGYDARWKRWHRHLLGGLLQRLLFETGPVAVNLNSLQAADRRIVRTLLGMLQGGAAGRLWIEWTEYEAPQLMVLQAADNLRRLRTAGARIAIDDAGVGIDWEERAALVSPHVVKLDGTLLHAAAFAAGGRDWQTARRIVRTARERYRAPTAAEWIEHTAHLETARQLGCTYGQGVHFTRGALQ